MRGCEGLQDANSGKTLDSRRTGNTNAVETLQDLRTDDPS